MSQRTALFAFVATTFIAAPAFACGPAFHPEELVPILAGALAVPYFVAATLTLALMARRWSLGFWGWARTSVAAYGAAALSAAVGLGIVFGLEFHDDMTSATVIASTPFLGTLAYVLWIRSRRHLRAERQYDTELEA